MLERLFVPQPRFSTREGIVLSVVAAALAGATDYASGPYLWWVFVYVLPAALLSWMSPAPVAWVISILAGLTTTLVNLSWDAPERHFLVPYWNGVATSATCLAVSLAMCKLRGLLRENELVTRVVSHDLMNILTALRMNADYLLSQTDRADSRFPLAQSITSATTRMRRLVSDLTISTLGDGKALQIEFAPLDVVHLATEAVGFVQAAAAARSVKVVLQAPPVPLYICGDAERIAEALDNLLGNALKFTPAGGSVELSLESRPAEVEIHVRDTGPGVASHERSAVFKAYWQGRAGLGGAGLGLHIAKVIVEKHGGTIWVGGGASGADFGIRLPRNEDKAAAPPK